MLNFFFSNHVYTTLKILTHTPSYSYFRNLSILVLALSYHISLYPLFYFLFQESYKTSTETYTNTLIYNVLLLLLLSHP